MAYKHSCVVDEQGFYRTLVLVTSETNSFDDATVYSYHLQPGERLIDAKPPGGAFCKPRWNGTGWTEAATEEQLAAWQASKEQPAGNSAPGTTERLEALESAMLAVLMGGAG